MTTRQCTEKHTYTITGRADETLASTTAGPKLAWVMWTNAGPEALDITADHPDGALCLPETRAARTLLSHGPYDTRKQARIDGRPLREAIDAANPDDGPVTDAIRDAARKAASDYVTGRLTHLGVELGEFDQRVAAWLADWEPEIVAVVLGWAARARDAGRDAAARQ